MICPVEASAKAHGARVALRFGDRSWTWAEADAEVARLASQIARGTVVVRQSFNTPELAWTFFACARAGALFVPINARLTESEVKKLPLPQGEGWGEGAVTLFTSGTTGTRRAIMLGRAQFEANAKASAERLRAEPTDRWLGTLPLFHVGGLAMLYRCAKSGASIDLEPHFDAQRVADALNDGATHASLVPTMLDRVLERFVKSPQSRVHAILIGGGPMSPSTLARARAAGLPVLQTYGLTEACSQVTTEVPGEADGTSAGPPIPGVEVRIVNADTEGIGEIEVKGPTVAEGLGPWLATKDLGRLDARGRLTIFARRTDLILSGGENVYPAEVEAALREHPSISDVAVAPRDDAEWGQIVVAVIVTNETSDEALTKWARERLASFKVPRAWVRVMEVPRNATGKVDRAALLQLAKAGPTNAS